MKNPPLIHIGYPKCASTTLQLDFFLKCPDITYLGAGMPRDTVGSDEYELLLNLASLGKSEYEQQRNRITDAIKGYLSTEKQGVISCEFLTESSYTPYEYETWADSALIAERLKEIFPNAKILIIIRNQLTFFPSLYVEKLRQPGVSVKWDEYITQGVRTLTMGNGSVFHRGNYFDLYQNYTNLFGKGNVCLLPMEGLISAPVESLQKIIDHIDCNSLDPRHYPFSRRNLRISRIGLYILKKRILKTACETILSEPVRARLYSLGNTLEFELPDDVRSMLSNYYSFGNRKLSNELGIALKQLGYPV